jgi:hypothetical protein
MSSNLRVNNILPSVGTNVAIGTAGGSVTLTGSVTGSSIINTGTTVVAAGSTSAPSISPTGDSNTGIFFPSADTVAIAEGGVEALRVDSSGRVGIGTDIPGSYDSGGRTLVISENSTLAGMTLRSSNQGAIYFADGLTGNEAYRGRIEYSHSSDSLNFGTAGTGSKLTLTSAGVVQVANGNLVFSTAGTGIDFSATANSSGTMTSELLSDYEEGTWTITDQSGASLTFSVNYGHYTKVGRLVTFIGHVLYPSTANGSNSQLGGLPFNPISSNPGGADMGYGGCISFTDESTLETISVFSASNIQLGTLSGGRLTNSTLSGNRIEFFGQYYV